MTAAAPGEGQPRPRVATVMIEVRRLALAVAFVAVALLIIVPTRGPAVTLPTGASRAVHVEAADSLSHDTEVAASRSSEAVASLAEQVVAARNVRDGWQHQLAALQGISYRTVTQILPADTATDMSESRTAALCRCRRGRLATGTRGGGGLVGHSRSG